MNAAGILLTHDDRALFLKRSDKSRDHAGEWCCPGGSLEDGETAEQAALRETAEETGLAGLVQGDLNRIDEGDGFVTFRQNVDEEPAPVLNDEHTEFRWAPLVDPPQPLHPGVASTLKKLLAPGAVPDLPSTGALDKREWDTNGWFEVLDNPLSTVGVYQYSEASVVKGGDPNKMVGVYRPESELSDPEAVKSFRLCPWTDDHPEVLLGSESQGLMPAEKKGVHGVTGEQIYYRDGTLYGNIKVFSEELARKLAAGKRELSLGYRCDFVPQEGVYEGKPFQYVQKVIRGNHFSTVDAGRMGAAVRVMDATEERVQTLCFALDLKEAPAMSACDACGRAHDGKDCLDADTLKFIEDSFSSLVGGLEQKGYSKEYATKVAGKVAAEKGMTGHQSQSTDGDTTVAEKTEAEMKKEADDRKAARDARDAARGTRDSARDAMSSEEEAAADAAECAEDASEEKEDKDDKSDEAKDRKSARDRRAGARDGRKMGRDRSARDAAARDAKGGKGMDAAAVTALVDSQVKTQVAAQVAARVAEIGPTLRREEAAKNGLYARLSPQIGAFDHADMTLPAMASYGLKKLGVTTEAADPVSALDFLLLGRSQAVPASNQPHHAALDAREGDNFMAKYLNA